MGKWTVSEESKLRELFSETSLDELQKIFEPRTLCSILTKAYHLGLKRQCLRESWSRWTEKEIEILQQSYQNGIANLENLAVLLPLHSKLGIRAKASTLGLCKKMEIKLPLELNDFQKGVVVGLIEGEGALGLIARIRRKPDAGRQNLSTAPYLSVSNTDLGMLKKFEEILGCGITLKNSGTTHPRISFQQKAVYVWRTSSSKVIANILRQLKGCWLSYRKERTAELVLEFCEIREQVLRKGSRSLGLHDPHEFEISREVLELNKRGLGPVKSLGYLDKLFKVNPRGLALDK
jgi:hypothetical protein